MIESVLNLFVGGLFCFAMIGLGLPIVERWSGQFSSYLERVILAAGIGAGIMSMLVLSAGFLGLLYPLMIWVLVVTGLIVGGLSSRGCYSSRPLILQSRKLDRSLYILGFLVTILLLSDLIAALAPPSFADALAAYLALPKLFVKAHRFYFAWSVFSGFPGGVEALFSAGIALRNGIVANLVNLFFGLLATGGIYLIARRCLHLPKTFILISLLLYLSLPTTTQMMSAAKPDLALAAYTVLALYSLLNWRNRLQRKWLVVSGIFAGLAVGSKTQGLFVLVALGFCFLALIIMSGKLLRLREWWPSLVVLGGIAVLVGSPYYLRNWAWTGNPFWPLMNETFGGCCLSPGIAKLLELGRLPRGDMLAIAMNFLLGPWRLMTDIEFFENIESVATPALIALLPGLLLLRGRIKQQERQQKEAIITILMYSIVFYIVWFFNRPRAHYLDPLWPALALASAFTAAGLVERSRLVAIATWLTITVSIAFGIGLSGLMNIQFVPVVVGMQTHDEFLRQKTWYYDDIQYINHALPPQERLLSFPNHTYYLDVDYLWGSIHVQSGLLDYFSIHSSEALLARFKELGITHILWDKFWFHGMETWVEHYGMTWELPEQFAELVNEGHLVPVYAHDTRVPTSRTLDIWQPSRVVLYRVKY